MKTDDRGTTPWDEYVRTLEPVRITHDVLEKTAKAITALPTTLRGTMVQSFSEARACHLEAQTEEAVAFKRFLDAADHPTLFGSTASEHPAEQAAAATPAAAPTPKTPAQRPRKRRERPN